MSKLIDLTGNVTGFANRHKRLLAIFVTGVILTALFAATYGQTGSSGVTTSYTVGTQQNWTISAQVDGGQFGTYTYEIPATVDTSQLPTQIVGTPTGTSLVVDPDRTSTTLVPWDYGGSALAFYAAFYPYMSLDGPLPQIASSITLVWHTDQNGKQTNPKVPDSTWVDAAGVHWERHYFIVQVAMQTQTHACSKVIQTGDPLGLNPFMNTYENALEHVSLWVKIIATPVGDKTFSARYDSAKIITPPQTEGSGIEANGNPFIYYLSSNYNTQSGDDQATIQNDLNGNSALSPLNNTMGTGGGSFMLQASGNLQAGVLYNYGVASMKNGINNRIDVLLTYGFLIGVDLSAPPTNPNLPPQWMLFFLELSTALQQPGNWWMWLLIAGILRRRPLPCLGS